MTLELAQSNTAKKLTPNSTPLYVVCNLGGGTLKLHVRNTKNQCFTSYFMVIEWTVRGSNLDGATHFSLLQNGTQ